MTQTRTMTSITVNHVHANPADHALQTLIRDARILYVDIESDISTAFITHVEFINAQKKAILLSQSVVCNKVFFVCQGIVSSDVGFAQ